MAPTTYFASSSERVRRHPVASGNIEPAPVNHDNPVLPKADLEPGRSIKTKTKTAASNTLITQSRPIAPAVDVTARLALRETIGDIALGSSLPSFPEDLPILDVKQDTYINRCTVPPSTLYHTPARLNGIPSVTGVELLSKDPVYCGGEANVYRGSYNGKLVAIRTLRLFASMSEDRRATRRESTYSLAHTWHRLEHDNILPLIGITEELTEAPCLLFPWMEDGTIVPFLEQRRDVDPLPLLQDIAAGLCYMHTLRLIHGDVKPDNVLIRSLHGRWSAMLCDIGSTTPSPSHSVDQSQILPSLSPAYMAPELACDNKRTTYKSDVFGFGMTCCRIYFPDLEFHRKSHETQWVARAIREAQRPEKPSLEKFDTRSVRLWDILERCWSQQPIKRPTMNHVFSELCGITNPILETGEYICPAPVTLLDDTSTITHLVPSSSSVASVEKFGCIPDTVATTHPTFKRGLSFRRPPRLRGTASIP